jgi:hypothetical protein
VTNQVDTTTDTITENANQGTDTVQSSVTYTLGNGVADLRYESSFVGFLKPRPKLTFG